MWITGKESNWSESACCKVINIIRKFHFQRKFEGTCLNLFEGLVNTRKTLRGLQQWKEQGFVKTTISRTKSSQKDSGKKAKGTKLMKGFFDIKSLFKRTIRSPLPLPHLVLPCREGETIEKWILRVFMQIGKNICRRCTPRLALCTWPSALRTDRVVVVLFNNVLRT